MNAYTSAMLVFVSGFAGIVGRGAADSSGASSSTAARPFFSRPRPRPRPAPRPPPRSAGGALGAGAATFGCFAAFGCFGALAGAAAGSGTQASP